MKNIREFFDFCLERESVRKKKEAGLPKPWTNDPVLRESFFCNIYREFDKTTVWFRENVRDLLRDSASRVLMATIAFRWFNLPETAAEILPWLQAGAPRSGIRDARATVIARRSVGEPVFSGAYIISSPYGDPKVEWAFRCIDDAHDEIDVLLHESASIQSLWAALCGLRGIGPFMAYEICTDLRWTCVLENAKDILTWANPGPGCARGLGWLSFDYGKGMFNRSKSDIYAMLVMMREILNLSREEPFDVPWEMREVEHSLCEYDKWRRGHNGEKLKRRYR